MKAIELTKGMTVRSLVTGEEYPLGLHNGSPKTYNINGGRIIFYNSESKPFATTAINSSIDELIAQGYTRDDSLYVPFCSLEAYPKAFKEQWASMLAEMRAEISSLN